MDRIYLALAMDLTDTAPDGAGWYVDVIIDGKRVMDPLPIPPEAAYEVAQDIQRAMQASEHELPNIQLPQLVQSGSQGIYLALHKQLADAEEHASRINTLRKKLQIAQQLGLAPPPVARSAILEPDATTR